MLNDAEIILLCKDAKTKEKGFNFLVNKFQSKVYWQLRKILIDHDDTNDVMQNVFVKVWDNIENFKEESSLYTWIFRISYNEALSFMKKYKKNFIVPIDSNNELKIANNFSYEKHYSANEIENKLQKALTKLTDRQRIIFSMRYFEELSFDAISKILDTNINTLKTTYHFSLKKIEKFLKNN